MNGRVIHIRDGKMNASLEEIRLSSRSMGWVVRALALLSVVLIHFKVYAGAGTPTPGSGTGWDYVEDQFPSYIPGLVFIGILAYPLAIWRLRVKDLLIASAVIGWVMFWYLWWFLGSNGWLIDSSAAGITPMLVLPLFVKQTRWDVLALWPMLLLFAWHLKNLFLLAQRKMLSLH
jgi:hypothetical protein